MPRLSLLCAAALAAWAAPARAGLLYGIVNPNADAEGTWVGQVVLPNASLRLQSTAPTNFFFASQMAGLSSDGRTFYTLCTNLTTRWMDLCGLDLKSGALAPRWRTPLAAMFLEGQGQAFAFMPAAGEAALMGANSTAVGAALTVSAVSAATGATRALTSIDGSKYVGFWPGYAAYSPKSNHFFFQLRNTSNEGTPAAFFVNMDTGAVVTRAGCWLLGVAYDATTDAFVGLAQLSNGSTINSTYLALASLPADGSGDCTLGAVVLDEGTSPYTVGEDVLAFDPEDSRLYVYAEPSPINPGSQPSLSLLSISSTDGSYVAYDASLTPTPSALLVSGMCREGNDCREGEGRL